MACLPPGAGAEVFHRLISVLTGLASPVSEICMSWAFLPSFIFPASLLLSCKVTQRPIVAVPAMFSLCVWAPLHCHYAAKKGKGLHIYIPSLGNQTFPPLPCLAPTLAGRLAVVQHVPFLLLAKFHDTDSTQLEISRVVLHLFQSTSSLGLNLPNQLFFYLLSALLLRSFPLRGLC